MGLRHLWAFGYCYRRHSRVHNTCSSKSCGSLWLTGTCYPQCQHQAFLGSQPKELQTAPSIDHSDPLQLAACNSSGNSWTSPWQSLHTMVCSLKDHCWVSFVERYFSSWHLKCLKLLLASCCFNQVGQSPSYWTLTVYWKLLAEEATILLTRGVSLNDGAAFHNNSYHSTCLSQLGPVEAGKLTAVLQVGLPCQFLL